MVKQGIVSSVDLVNRKARVTFQDTDNVVTADIPYAQHVSPLINDVAVVALFSPNLANGMIIAVRREG